MLDSMEADRVLFSNLEARILDLERSLSELRAQRARVQERLGAYKYPVLTLPNEITSEIFLHFLPVYPDAPPPIRLDSPTTLTHVCRQWREVALATPALWRALKLSDYDDVFKSYKPIRRIFDAYIRRSGSCPLSIDIDIYDQNILDEIFKETFAMAATRLEHLKLFIPGGFRPNFGRMPLLRFLDVGVEDKDKAEVIIYDAPQLRTVVLRGDHLDQNLALPWAQLTSLTFNYVRIDRCTSILRQTTNLVRCHLLLHGGFYQFPIPDLTLLCLESLTLETPSRQTADFLSAFLVPALRSLHLQEAFLGINPIQALKTFIAKSECRLQEVCITYHSTNGNTHFEQYQLAFPSISISYRPAPKRAWSPEI